MSGLRDQKVTASQCDARPSLIAASRVVALAAWVALFAAATATRSAGAQATARDRGGPEDAVEETVPAAPDDAPAPGPAAGAAGARAVAEPQVAAVNGTLRLFAGQSKTIEAPWPVRRISIDQPQVADIQMLSPDRIQVLAKTSGSARLTMSNADEETVETVVEVEADVRALQAQLANLFPRSTLEVTQLGDVAVVRGTLSRAEEGAQLEQFLGALKLNYVDMTGIAGVQQVQLQVRVAEVSRGALRTLGVNVLNTSRDFFGGVTLGTSAGPLVPTNIGVPEGTPAGPNLPFEFLSDVNVPSAVTLFAGFPRADLEVFIQALEENQYLRLLAEPNLVALSGEEATFLAGGEFPIPVAQGSGDNATITVEYKEFGVRLGFRPTVLGDGTVRLNVEPEVSELSDVGAVELQGFRIPSVVTRRVQTTIELKSGQTFGMAGLINRTTSARVSRVPGLGALPILGPLFRSVRYSQNESELVVLVTATLVEPLSTPMSSIPVPGVQHRPPSPWELYALGRIEGEAPPRASARQSRELRRLGLNELRGPGAWASHDRRAQSPAASRATSRQAGGQ